MKNKILSGLVVLPIVLVLTATLTGRTARQYIALRPDQAVQIGEKTETVAGWAKTYLPLWSRDERQIKEPLQAVWYEVVESQATYDFVYRAVWEDETHPNAFLDVLYRFWRKAYYGSSRDIEFIELKVDKKNASIKSLQFESGKADGDWGWKHIPHQMPGEKIHTENQTHPLLVIHTTNHLVRLQHGSESAAMVRETPEVHALDEAQYQMYKMARRSQGTHRSREPRLGSMLVAGIVFGILWGWLNRQGAGEKKGLTQKKMRGID